MSMEKVKWKISVVNKNDPIDVVDNECIINNHEYRNNNNVYYGDIKVLSRILCV